MGALRRQLPLVFSPNHISFRIERTTARYRSSADCAPKPADPVPITAVTACLGGDNSYDDFAAGEF